MHKGLQLGGAIGASSSVLLALAGPRGFRFVKRLVQITALTSTAGMATGVGGAVKKISSLPESEQQDGIEDRAFRIFHNRKQNLVDRYSCVGVGMGMIGGTVVCGLSLSGLIGGAGLGAAAAIGVVIAKNKTASQK
mmetsp:Transcript_33072/g.46161  ORF Transcript_33072/g.46161 Transcript_33072/m.46161 type:complete len:136 (+) Transcript_33072:266-673(+)